MKLEIMTRLIIFIALAATCYGKLAYRHVGCYNEQERSFPKYLGHKEKWACAATALLKGYKAFALQNGKECWTGHNSHNSYNKYGVSTSCKKGKGGNMSNDVYIIGGFSTKKIGCVEKDFAGLRPNNAIKNCKTLKAKKPHSKSGIYWMNPTGQKAFQGYCDMDTVGGGWTLVYSYTFTNYNSFTSNSNAVIPQPDWPFSGGTNTRTSTEPPLSETHYAAMHFNLWKTIGSEFMIKSNINHWIKCTEGSGSLVKFKTGTINCKVVKNIVAKCQNVLPDYFDKASHGPYLSRKSGSFYYYYDVYTKSNWPTHDPCGTNRANQLNGVANPHGNIYIR